MRAKIAGVAAALTLTAGSVSGCVPSSGFAAGENSISSGNDINPQPVSALRDGGELRIAAQSFPSNFNILNVDGATLDTDNIVAPTLPTSFVSDASGVASVNRDYFTDAKITHTNPQQVTFTINPKAVWSDGTPITWEDLASEATALSGRDPRYQIAGTSGFERVATVERGVDDRQAVLTFSEPYGQWLGMYSPVYPKAITATPEAFNNADHDTLAVSSGPFRIVSVDKVQSRVTLARDPRWWGAPPKLDRITYSVLDPSAWVPAMQNNEIDTTIYSLSNLTDVTTARSASSLTVRRSSEPSYQTITLNGAPDAILADPARRVAISKAIDRRGITRASLFGLANDPQPLNNHVFMRGQQGYQDNSAAIAFDPTAAGEELDRLGWVRRGDVREKNGRKLILRAAVTQVQDRIQIAQIAQQNLKKIGVRVEIVPHPTTGYFSDVINPGNFDLAVFGWSGSAFPLVALPQIYAYDPNNPQGNAGRIGTPEINALIGQAVAELDPAKAAAISNVVDRKLFEEGFSLTLYQYPGDLAVRSSVANFGAFGMATPDYTTVGFMK